MKKIVNRIVIIFFLIIGIFTWISFHDIMFIKTPQVFSGNVATLTGNLDISIASGQTINTGNDFEELSDLDLYKKYVSAGNVISFNPTHQPVGNSATYEANTTILNQYLAKNTNYIDITKYPGLKNGGYLYVRTKENPSDGIFMYWYNAYGKCGKPVSGKLIQSSKYKVSDTEFLYPLDNIEILAYYNKENCIFNWKDEINNRKNQYIGGYVASTKGNTIEEISIAWK